MTSDSLQRLKALGSEYSKLQAQAQAQVKFIKDNYIGTFRQQELVKARVFFATELDALREKRLAAQADIDSRGKGRAVPPTPEAVDRVRIALARGMEYRALVQQLTKDGDRAGLSALRAELPYMGKLMPADVTDSVGFIDIHEERLWNDRERRYHQEVRAAGVNAPLFAQNEAHIDKWLGYQIQGDAAADQRCGQLYGWYDLPATNQQPEED